MAILATPQQMLDAYKAIKSLNPACREAIAALIKAHRMIGHGNLNHMILGASPVTFEYQKDPNAGFNLLQAVKAEGPDSPLWAMFDGPKVDPSLKALADMERKSLQTVKAETADPDKPLTVKDLRQMLKQKVGGNKATIDGQTRNIADMSKSELEVALA